MPSPEVQHSEISVLVTGAGGPAAIAVLKSLRADPSVGLLAADMDCWAAGLYLVPRAARSVIPACLAPEFCELLLARCLELGADVVIPTVDAELRPLAAARHTFEQAGVRLMLASASALDLTLDKLALARACAGVVRVPRTERLDADTDPDSWSYPVVVKPRTGSGSRDITVIVSAAELKALEPSADFIIQEYLPGEEYSIDVLADIDGRVVAGVPRVRARVDSGVSVAGRTLHDRELEWFGAAVAERVGLTFISNVQVRRDQHGQPALLEVNPRVPGSLPLTVASGVDMPRMALDALRGRRLPEHAEFCEKAMVRFLEERFLDLSDLSDRGVIIEKWILVALVMAGAIPLVVASYQFLLIGWHSRRLHYAKCAPYFPRTAILIPAWNEAAVLGASIDRLMGLEYPGDRLRVFVIDDASTDQTPQVVAAKAAQYPGSVVHLRREVGGQGKAHTLNHGLARVLADDWTQAVLIMDSDVIYEPPSLRLMTRHLADPQVGAVTAYIKEGSRPGNYLTRFIGYEYITAQAAARRSQNVIGAIACLAGGAQLHSRANLEAIGGQIDTGTLAEDTITTFKTQLRGAKVVFEPHAVVWAEEPGTIGGLWKQRLRWARGNIQVSLRFWRVWFRPSARPRSRPGARPIPGNRLGSISFGLFWFALLLQPIFMIVASASLITLFFIDKSLAWDAFHALWITNLLTYAFITSFALLIDPPTGRRVWREALLFPGAISVIIMIGAIAPVPLRFVALHGLSHVGAYGAGGLAGGVELFTYVWLGGSMLVAYLAKLAESRFAGRFTSPVLIYLAGYGSLLCAVTFAAFVKQLRGAEVKWDKTEKTGKVAINA